MSRVPSNRPLTQGPVLDLDRTTEELDRLSKDYAIEKIEKMIAEPYKKAVAFAKGIDAFRRLLTDDIMKEWIMKLQDTPLGFTTDRRGKGGYSLIEVREALIEASMKGAYPVGNEFMIISGRAYLAQAFYVRKLGQFPGLTNFKPSFTVPKTVPEVGCVVGCKATWLLDGKPDAMEQEYAIRLNSGQGADAAIGKAKRKFYRQVFEYLCGYESPAVEKEFDEDVIEHQPAQPQLPAQAQPPNTEEDRDAWADAIQQQIDQARTPDDLRQRVAGEISRYEERYGQELALELMDAFTDAMQRLTRVQQRQARAKSQAELMPEDTNALRA